VQVGSKKKSPAERPTEEPETVVVPWSVTLPVIPARFAQDSPPAATLEDALDPPPALASEEVLDPPPALASEEVLDPPPEPQDVKVSARTTAMAAMPKLRNLTNPP
jgi:hypothetical protein